MAKGEIKLTAEKVRKREKRLRMLKIILLIKAPYYSLIWEHNF